jgi:hypothetical protein
MTHQYSVKPLLSTGFGFGDPAKPGYDDQKMSVRTDYVRAVQNLLYTSHILTLVDRLENGEVVSDDGCGDGRGVARVFEGSALRKRSLCRPKVFGGGVTMTMAMQVGLGYEADKQLPASFDAAMQLLHDHGLNYGAHTDNHAADGKSGCGAIDNAPVVMQNIVKYQDQIRQTLLGLGLGFEESQINEVLANFAAYAAQVKGRPYSGQAIVNKIKHSGKVVKELDGEHKELFVLLNMVDGTSADQSLVRDITEGQVQLFDVDVWRLVQLANTLYVDPAEQQEALISELVYTLGVAATLTHGDLPVYLAAPAKQPALV